MKTIIFSIFLFILFFVGCSHIPIDTQRLIAEEVGEDLAYFTLKKNPKYIPKIEPALKVAIAMADEDNVDLGALIDAIVEYMTGLQDNPDFSSHNAFIASKAKRFNGLFLGLDLSVPEEYQMALARCRAFLDGALSGLEMAKGE